MHVLNIFAKMVEVHNWIQSKYRRPHLKQKQMAQTNVEQMLLVSTPRLVLFSGKAEIHTDAIHLKHKTQTM